MDAPLIYHGTPITPNAALAAVMPGRAACVSFYRPDQIRAVDIICPDLMLDNGAFSFWTQARRARQEHAAERDWSDFYAWVEPRIGDAGRWAVIPDMPGAPSQLNDGLLNEWPHGTEFGAPLWHMDGPISRLLRLCERYERVCLGWIGEFDPSTGDIRAEEKDVGCPAWFRRMDEVAAAMGNRWHNLHMMRGVAVSREYPFRQRRQHVTRAKRASVSQGVRVRRSVAGDARLCR